MALVKCEECGKDVSTQAETCPHCGAPQGSQAEQPAEPKKKKKGAGCGTLIFVILAGTLLVTFLSQQDSNTPSVSSPSHSPSTTQKAKPAAQTKEQYMEQLATEYESLKTFNVSKWTETKERIIICTALFSTLVQIAESSKRFQLTPEETKTLERFKKKLSSVQVSAFPKLRDAYGPAIRQLLWESDMSAKTIGAGYRIIEWVGAAFAANRNKKEWQTKVQGVLYKLRFTQSRYKWYKEEDKYTYYTMKPPKDSQLVEWTSDTTFRVID